MPVFMHATGNWRPRWRGRIHAIAVAVTIPAGIILTPVYACRSTAFGSRDLRAITFGFVFHFSLVPHVHKVYALAKNDAAN